MWVLLELLLPSLLVVPLHPLLEMIPLLVQPASSSKGIALGERDNGASSSIFGKDKDEPKGEPRFDSGHEQGSGD